MRRYFGFSTDFIRDSGHNRIAEKVKDARLHDHGIRPTCVSVDG